MRNHRWVGNTCNKCGLIRERKTHIQIMVIVNHPPWEVTKRESKFRYHNGTEWTWKRPDCN